MSISLLYKKKCLFPVQLGDLEGFDLIISENLDKSLEYVCNGIPIQQNKEPTPEFFTTTMSLLSFYFLTGQKPATGYILDSLACSQYNSCAYIINTFLGGTLNHHIVFMYH